MTGLSYAKGPSLNLLHKTIGQVLHDTASRYSDRDALIVRHENLRLNWRELEERVEQTARGLIGLGLEPGDRVGVWATNCAEWVYMQFGCARAGIVLVNVNPAYRSNELAYVLKKSGMKALFLRREDSHAHYGELFEQARKEQPSALQHAIFLKEESWDQMIANGSDIGPGPSNPHDVVNIQYTSGTTGSPKGVLLTHHNLVNNAHVVSHDLAFSERDKICIPVPLYHCFGCVAGTLGALVSGAAMILPSASFDPLHTMEAISEERATVIYGVPTMFIAQLHHPEFHRFDFTSLRTGIMAGAPCPVEVMRLVIDDMHCTGMTVGYGQTEASPIITLAQVDDSVEHRVETVGRTCPETEVKIVSPEGETLTIGEHGELCSRGYLIMKGYDQDPAATTKAVDKDGWLHTGDLASMRPDGYIHITGRLRDMIIRGGENIYPREIEDFLYSHPKVADVQIVGLPDEKYGETVCAWIRLKPGEAATEAEIHDYCQNHIAHYKVPQWVRFVDSFPMTVTGKIQKFRIKEIEIKERHLEKAAGIRTA